MALSNLLLQPYPRFSTFTEPGYNALKHGNGFFFEAIGDDVLRLHEILTLIDARGIQDEQKVPTDDAVFMPRDELKQWFRSPSGPCTLSYFLENRDQLAVAIVHTTAVYANHISRLLKTEWNPYLAGIDDDLFIFKTKTINLVLGLFVYACRYQMTISGICYAAESPETVAVRCTEQQHAADERAAGDRV